MIVASRTPTNRYRRHESVPNRFESDEAINADYANESVLLGGRLDDTHRLRKSVPVHVHREDWEYVATLHDPVLTGFGPTRSAALSDLKFEIVGQLRLLESAGDDLSDKFKKERAKLRNLIVS